MARSLVVLVSLLATSRATPTLAGAPDSGRLYVSNSADTSLTVIDLADHQVVASVEVGEAPHGLAMPADGSVLWVASAGRNELVAVDPVALEVKRRIPTGPEPHQIAVTPDGSQAWVPVRDGHWEVIDLASGQILRRIPVGGRPHNTLASADGQRMYLAALGAPRKVAIADVGLLRVVGQVGLKGSVAPFAIDAAETRLYAQLESLDGFEVSDLTTRRWLGRFRIAPPQEAAMVVSRSHGIAIRPDQAEVWLSDTERGAVAVFDRRQRPPRQTDFIPVGPTPYWIAFDPVSAIAYITLRDADEVVAVDSASKTVQARIPVGRAPKRLLIAAAAGAREGRR